MEYTPSKELIHVEEYIPSKELITEIMIENIGRPLELKDLEKWSVSNGQFISTFDAEVNEIECVIFEKRYERRYYKDQNSLNTPPDCYSNNMKQGNGNPGGVCAECPNSFFIEDNGTACIERAEVIFIKKGDMIPSRINLPYKSMKEFKKYLFSLTYKGKLFKNIITKMSLSREKNAAGQIYSIVRFENIGEISGHREALKAIEKHLTPLQYDV